MLLETLQNVPGARHYQQQTSSMVGCTRIFCFVRLWELALSKHILMRLRLWENGFSIKALKLRWKPEEGKMAYNQRTSALIKGWFLQYGRSPIHYRILRAVFDQAWNEKTLSSHGSVTYLALSRKYRTREFWTFVKDLPGRVRGGWVHAGRGPRTEWEDVFCTAFDVSWRKVRDALRAAATRNGNVYSRLSWRRFATSGSCQYAVQQVWARHVTMSLSAPEG